MKFISEKLTELLLSNNKLTNLPNEIGNLINLKNLTLYNNELTSIPNEIGNLTNLTVLVLSNNKLKALPNEIGNLTKLTNFFSSHNQLKSLPNEFSKLVNLNQVDLASNQFWSFPVVLFNLPLIDNSKTPDCYFSIYRNEFFQQIPMVIKKDIPGLRKYFEKNQHKTWTKLIHNYSFQSTKECIKTILILNLKEETTRKPKYEESLIHLLPKEILIEVFEHLPLYQFSCNQ